MLKNLYIISSLENRTNSFNSEIYLVTGIRNTDTTSSSCQLKSSAVEYKRNSSFYFKPLVYWSLDSNRRKGFPERIYFYFIRTYSEGKATSSSYLNNPKVSTLTRQQDHRRCENDHLMLGTTCEGCFVWALAKSLPVADLHWHNLLARLVMAGWGASCRILGNNQICTRDQLSFVF